MNRFKKSVTWQSRVRFAWKPCYDYISKSVTTDSDAFFCFSKKVISECLRATQWKFDYSPSEKPLLKYWLLDGFTIVRFCFWKDTSVASAMFALAFAVGVSGTPDQGHRTNFWAKRKKGSLCILALNLFFFWFSFIFLCYLLEIAPDVTKWSQKSLSKAKT